MRKRELLTILLITLFFLNLNKVHAFVGPYSYDINSVTVQYGTDSVTGATVPDTMTINGWAVVRYNNGASEIHNIQPKYVLRIVGKDTSGNEVFNSVTTPDLVSADVSSKPDYTSASTYAPSDLTVAYFDGGVYTSHHNGDRSSNNLICGRVGKNNASGCNHMFINVHFQFNIFLSNIKNLAQSIQKNIIVYMYLDVSTEGGVKTVYGTNLSTTAYTASPINVGIQENRVPVGDLSNLRNYGISFGNLVKQVNLIATDAKARCSTNFKERRIWNDSGSKCKIGVGSPLQLNYGNAGETYDVIKSSPGSYDSNYTNPGVFMYHVKIKPSSGKDGGSLDTYIPAFWTKPPVDLKTYLYFTPSGPTPPTDITGSDTPDNRPLTCNSNLETTFDYSTPKVVYSNNLCSIKCGEKLTAKFQPATIIKAGTGFSYPADFTGTRTCQFSFDGVDTWTTDMNNAVTSANTLINDIHRLEAIPANRRTSIESDTLSSDWILYNNWVSQITNLNNDYSYCSANSTNWTDANKYEMNANVNASTGTTNENVEYIRTVSSTTSTQSGQSHNSYNVAQCVGDCSSTSTATINTYNWTETSTMTTKYEFSNYYYVEMLTGEKTTEPIPENSYYEIGRKYLTELNSQAGRYNFDITLNNVGRNGIAGWDKKWSINVDCYYDVINPDFPPGQNLGFRYRQISLTDPFPGGRTPGNNWLNQAAIINHIKQSGYSIYDQDPSYLVSLTPEDMRRIRVYNSNTTYGDSDLDASGASKFIHTSDYYSSLFIRK